MFTKVAKSTPFEGYPRINTPSIIGAQIGKRMMYRIPATGQRPLKITIDNLPAGLTFTENPNVISGVLTEGTYVLKISCENAIGKTTKKLKIEVGEDAVPRSPLMGWTSWNAYFNLIDQLRIMNAAKIIAESGLADYGYAYVNIDSGWQGSYGGRFGGIMPNELFPDMYKLVEDIHAYGLKAGIYSSPMIHNYGSTELMRRDYIGTTSGELDTTLGNESREGIVRHETECARQFGDWRFDYLKYDWNPARIYHLAPMVNALRRECDREFAVSATCHSDIRQRKELMALASSVRDNTDSKPRWDVVTEMISSGDRWLEYTKPGHFFDTDMLDTGVITNNVSCDEDKAFRSHYDENGGLCYTEDEEVFEYTMRVIMPSPIQLSCKLDKMTAFEFDLYTNEEVIAINQDSLCAPAKLERDDRDGEKYVRIYRKPLENGDEAVAIFNIGETGEPVTVNTGRTTRDAWAKEAVPTYNGKYTAVMPPRTCVLLRTGK